jgi:hypothetical protein
MNAQLNVGSFLVTMGTVGPICIGSISATYLHCIVGMPPT